MLLWLALLLTGPQATCGEQFPFALHKDAPFSTVGGYTEGYRGWSSWSLQAYRADGYGFQWLNESNVMQMAEVVATRLLPFGYSRINLDSGWSGTQDEYGRPTLNPVKFPSGAMKMSSFLNKMGLELGLYFLPGIVQGAVDNDTPVYNSIYSARDIVRYGKRTVPANAFNEGQSLNYSHPGAQAYIDSIVQQLYQWNVSFVKLDGLVPGSSIDQQCSPWDIVSTDSDLIAWRNSIERLYPGGDTKKIWLTGSWELPPSQYSKLAQTTDSWRVSIDIEEYGPRLTTWDRVIRNVRKGALWTSTGHWRGVGLLDLDSVPIGDLHLEEAQSMITLWSIIGGPFYSGDDLRKLPETYFSLLTNRAVLEIQRLSAAFPARLIAYKQPTYKDVRSAPDEVRFLKFQQTTKREWQGWNTSDLTLQPCLMGGTEERYSKEWVHQRWWSEWRDGTVIFALINAGNFTDADGEATFTIDLKEIDVSNSSYRILDVWEGIVLGELTTDFPLTFIVGRHSSKLLKLSPFI